MVSSAGTLESRTRSATPIAGPSGAASIIAGTSGSVSGTGNFDAQGSMSGRLHMEGIFRNLNGLSTFNISVPQDDYESVTSRLRLQQLNNSQVRSLPRTEFLKVSLKVFDSTVCFFF